MQDKALVKEAVKSAEEELKNEEKMRIKSVVKATLELLQKKEESRKMLDDEIKILRKDIDDLREGRIDRIKERQELDSKAKDVSVIIVKEKIIEKHVPTPMWYVPWIIEVKPQYVPLLPQVWCTCASAPATTITADSGSFNLTSDCTSVDAVQYSFTTNNSVAHMHTSGTYLMSDGNVRYL